MPLPKQVIDDLMNDQDFLSLSEEDQDIYLDRIASKYGQMPKSENILQRAVKSLVQPTINSVGNTVGGILNKNPMQALQGIGSAQSSGYQGAMDAKNEMIGEVVKNPIARFGAEVATDPLTYLGGEAAKQTAQEAPGLFKKVFPYTSKEARVGFTKNVEKGLINRRSALTRGYGSVLNKSKATVDLSHIMDPGSEITQFTMKEAQDLKNAITQGIPEAVKKGVKVNPKYFQSRELAGMITDAMKNADEAMIPAIEKYGKHAENFKSAISPIKGARGTENIFGANLIKQMFGAGGSIPEKAQVAMEEFAPRIAKEVNGAKVNENIFRALRGVTLGAAASKFTPNILKKALLSKTTE